MARRIIAATGDSITRLERISDHAWQAKRVLPHLDAQCLAVDPLNPRKLYAGGESGGVYTSDDAGEEWHPVPSQPPQMHISALAVSGLERERHLGAIYAGTEPSALYKSSDGGETWQEIESLKQIPSAPNWSFPPRPWTSHVRWIELSPHDPMLMLVVIELGGIVRTSDGGVTWRDHPSDAYLDCHALAMLPTRPGVVYECAAGGFAISADSGLSWVPQDDGIDRRYLYSMAVNFHDPGLVYVGGSTDPFHAHARNGDAQAAIYRREPEGWWTRISDSMLAPLPYFPYGLATAPDEPLALYVGFADGTLAVTADRGMTWKQPEVEGEKPEMIQAMVVL